MKEIRRFQRTMITVLVGTNILVFSTSFYGDFSAALWQCMTGMAIVAVSLVAFSFIKHASKGKKSSQVVSPSDDN